MKTWLSVKPRVDAEIERLRVRLETEADHESVLRHQARIAALRGVIVWFEDSDTDKDTTTPPTGSGY